MNKVSQFIHDYIFFKVDKKQKKLVKNKLMMLDHGLYKTLLLIIFFLQLAMVVFTLVSSKFNISEKQGWYIVCYTSLAFFSLVFVILIEIFHNKQNSRAYFLVVAFAVGCFFLWAVGITVLDCYHGTDLTTYAYISLAITSFIILEPWIFIVDCFFFVSLLNILIVVVPDITYYTSTLISSMSIAFLTCAAGVVNFYRHIKNITLQNEVLELNVSLKESAYFDDLTKLHNRRYLTEHINDPVHIGTHPSGVFMLDLDDFKNVNDSYGHQNGDICLAAVGEAIVDFVKKIPGTYAVRYGGEEFLIFFEHTNNVDIRENAEALRLAVKNMDIVFQDGSTFNLTISIGVALSKPGFNYAALINKADNNLYFAKNGGKDQYYFE